MRCFGLLGWCNGFISGAAWFLRFVVVVAISLALARLASGYMFDVLGIWF